MPTTAKPAAAAGATRLVVSDDVSRLLDQHPFFASADPFREMMDIMEQVNGAPVIDFGFFDKLKMPTGENTFFPVPNPAAKNGLTPVSEVACIIFLQQESRAFWDEAYTGKTGVTPKCVSHDGRIGYGDPGGACESCFNAAFGSARLLGLSTSEKAQACRAKLTLYFLPLGPLPVPGLFPWALTLPPSSHYAWKQHNYTRLRTHGAMLWQVVTTLTLDTATGSIKFPKIIAETTSALPADAEKKVADFRNQFLAHMPKPRTLPNAQLPGHAPAQLPPPAESVDGMVVEAEEGEFATN